MNDFVKRLWQATIGIGKPQNSTEDVVRQECKHQFIPWLTLPSGSYFTECIECGKAYQYDY